MLLLRFVSNLLRYVYYFIHALSQWVGLSFRAMKDEEKSLKYKSLSLMFSEGSIKKMRDIEKLYPSMIARDLKLNYSRYLERLYKPEMFSLKQVDLLAGLLEIDPLIICKIILKQQEKTNKSSKRKL